MKLNKDDVKSVAQGRWQDILPALAQVDGEQLDGRHGPCPRCHGKDRFRAFTDGTGGAYCNGCFSENNQDGFATLMWLTGCTFSEAVERVADYLGMIRSTTAGPGPVPVVAAPQDPPKPIEKKLVPEFEKKFIEIRPSNDAARKLIEQKFEDFCRAKPPITVAALHAVSAKLVTWPNHNDGFYCIAFPAYTAPNELVGYIMRRADGSDFPAIGSLQVRKTHMLKGSQDGWVIPGGFDRVEAAEIVWRVEGVPDALALFSILPDDHAVITNICGAKTSPANIEIFRDKIVYSIGDADKPGRDGACIFAAKIKELAASVKVIKLLFPVVKDHGRDVRDWRVDGGTFDELLEIAEAAPEFVYQILITDGDGLNSESLREFGFMVEARQVNPNALKRFEEIVFCDTGQEGIFDELQAALLKLNPAIRFKDANLNSLQEWLESRDAADPRIIESELRTIFDGAPEKKPKPPEPSLKIRTAAELIREFPNMRRAVIEGVLRIGEVMNIISAPKFGKSWLILGLVLSVACGRKWLGRFWTVQGRVLLIDNECHPETLAMRLPRVAESLGIRAEEYAESISVITLRGDLRDLEMLTKQLEELQPGAFDLICLDAWYRLIPAGSDENANGDVTRLYNCLDATAHKIGCSFVCVHHSSKGSQTGKSVTDIGSGAGRQSRAPDTHMTLRAHEVDHAVVVEAAVRSWPPMDAFCMRWDFPTWAVADELDPKELRDSRTKKRTSDPDVREPTESVEDKKLKRDRDKRAALLMALSNYPEGETTSTLKGESRLSGSDVAFFRAQFLREKLIEKCNIKKNKRIEDAFKLTALGFTR